MSLLDTALELIDFRSFSNLWFWIALAALWSTASHWVVGVPFDLVRRAAAGEPQALDDMVVLANIQARRILFIADATGLISTALTFFMVTTLTLLGFLYWIEFAQALLLLFLPMMVVFWLTVRTARRIDEGLDPVDLGNLLAQHRRMVQGVGVVAIFVTSMFGMWINMNHSALG
ncbi:component of SufBCD complex [Jannaschia formosa]|uniref:component of SufBCD complex n=1 Tax=Jannaschia formosa TaxID=2259592 RepID=UPI000E1BCE22|nr:component of SufBCD complex [Jannaschia formosa]TFL17730.1 component of SufBCD complex [Jannaschia formosa]